MLHPGNKLDILLEFVSLEGQMQSACFDYAVQISTETDCGREMEVSRIKM